jgi:tRNA1Val (adenine37-N6)-methyltransferase
MKVGTDSLALGEWLDVRLSDRSMLDIGTGCGILSMLVASRASSEYNDDAFHITAIDIDAESAGQAAKNFAMSPWASCMAAECISLQDFTERFDAKRRIEPGFDLIFANPPYYPGGLRSPEGRRSLARSCDTLPYVDLIGCVLALLAPSGRFAMCMPDARVMDFVFHAAPAGLHVTRKELRGKLALLEFAR